MEHRIILYQNNLDYIKKETLEARLRAEGVMIENPAYTRCERTNEDFKYLLSPKYINLLETVDSPKEYYDNIHIWVELYTEPNLYAGIAITEIDVKEPGTSRVLGDNNLVMQLLEELHQNPHATYFDKKSGKTWYIRDLDYSHGFAYAKTFIMIDCGFAPTQAFVDTLADIMGCNIRYSFCSL